MSDDRNTTWTVAVSWDSLALGVGVLAMVGAFSFGVVPSALRAVPMSWQKSLAVGGIGLGLFVWALYSLPTKLRELVGAANEEHEPVRSKKLYGTFLVGIGYAMLMQALACSIVFSAVSWSVGRQTNVESETKVMFPETETEGFKRLFGSTPDEANFIVGLFVLSTYVAILGALFFFANALWKKMGEPERDPFDHRLFWGGLWFRIGEAVLFNLVLFLVLRYYAPARYLLLPLVSLLVGMFLKSGESLVSGIAARVFASIQALVPTDLGKGNAIKLLKFGLAVTADDVSAKTRMDALVAILRGLTGVDHVEPDDDKFVVRIEYNSASVTVDDIRRKVELKGFEMVLGADGN